MSRMLCTYMFDEGGCKKPHCFCSHSKEDTEKVQTRYAYFSPEKRSLITEDRFGTEYYIPTIVIDKYLNRLYSRDIDFTKMTYEGYFDKKSKDDRSNRYRFVHLNAVTEVKSVSNKETSSQISFERNSNNSNETKELSNKIDKFKKQISNYLNENSTQISIKFKEFKVKTDELIKTVEKQKKEINDLKEIVEKNRVQIDDLEKTLKRTNPYDLRCKKRVKYNN